MSNPHYESVSGLIDEILALLEEGSKGVRGLSEVTGLEVKEVYEIMVILERMELVEVPARPTDFALEAMKLPEGPEK